MPPPSSVMPIRRRPPPSVKISIRLAPASMAFSTSSLTTLAGRSTTSPAAMRLTTCSGSWRTGMGLGFRMDSRSGHSRPMPRQKHGGGEPNRFPLGTSPDYHIEDVDVRDHDAEPRDRFFGPRRGIVSAL